MNKLSSKSTKPLWNHPWGYRESFLIAASVAIIGFILEVISGGRGISVISWPANLYVLLIVINLIVISSMVFGDSPIIRWFSGVPAAVSAITIFTFFILMMGFTTQNDQEAGKVVRLLGLSHATRSWPYLMVQIYFLTTLGFVVIRRGWPLTKKNVGFLLNHLGLWITIVAATLGAGDLMRLNMSVAEGNTSMTARDMYGNNYEMPVAIKLLDFRIEEYPPKIGLIDNKTGSLFGSDVEKIIEASAGLKGKTDHFLFEVIEYLPFAAPSVNGYVSYNGPGATHAALVKISDHLTGKDTTGWIAAGSFMMPSEFIRLDNLVSFAMFRPTAKEYSSEVVIITPDQPSDTALIKVNVPVKVNGWKIYQISYDESKGRDSNISVFELVRDPWLIFVYIGIFMVIAGAVYIAWIGRKVKTEK
jgi:hypothetical protein